MTSYSQELYHYKPVGGRWSKSTQREKHSLANISNNRFKL